MEAVKERRRAIMEVLCVRRHETRGNLAFEFGVSKRTIEYDVQNLSLEYPIYTTQGKGGGIHVVEGFELKRKKGCFTDKQRSVLERLALETGGEDGRVLESILNSFSPQREDTE